MSAAILIYVEYSDPPTAPASPSKSVSGGRGRKAKVSEKKVAKAKVKPGKASVDDGQRCVVFPSFPSTRSYYVPVSQYRRRSSLKRVLPVVHAGTKSCRLTQKPTRRPMWRHPSLHCSE